MHLHLFPPPHLLPITISVGLALAAATIFAARRRLQVVASALGGSSFGRWRRKRRATLANDNKAFSEYRDETIRRLEREARDFKEFLAALRASADAKEFELFLAERRK